MFLLYNQIENKTHLLFDFFCLEIYFIINPKINYRNRLHNFTVKLFRDNLACIKLIVTMTSNYLNSSDLYCC